MSWYEKSDIEDVFLLLNQLKKLDLYSIDRKKIKDQFQDENFIVSYKDGYSIE